MRGNEDGNDTYIRNGEVLQEDDFGENFRPRPGDQIFFSETLYYSTRRGAKGTRAGKNFVHCTVGLRQRFLCDAAMVLRDRGALYFTTWTVGQQEFIAAVTGGTREFRSVRGDVVIRQIREFRSVYELRLR